MYVDEKKSCCGPKHTATYFAPESGIKMERQALLPDSAISMDSKYIHDGTSQKMR
jgi:hypothetical protein